MTLVPLLAVILASTPPAGDVPRAGYFGAGFNLEPLSLGAAQAFSGGGATVGVSLQTAIQLDAGPRWAFRLPLELGGGGAGTSSFAELGLTPGLLHRWRDDADQEWVPYLGGGFKLGVQVASRQLLGLPPITQALDIHLHHHHSGSSEDADNEGRLGAFPEVWGGVEWHPSRWFSLNLAGAYTYVRLGGQNLNLLHERIGLRFSL
jgi:hypothetical protein